MPSNLTHPMPASPLLGGQTQTDPLAALQPSIAPQPITWWPVAPGWWLVAALLLLLLGVSAIWILRRKRRQQATRYQREAHHLLTWVSTLDKQDTLAQLQEIARILRRAAISAYGREQAGVKPWTELVQLDQKPVFDDSSLHLLGNCLYQKQAPQPEEIQHLLTQAEHWLQQLPSCRGTKE